MRCVHPDMELLIAASATRSLMASTFAVKVRCIAQHIESPKGIYTLLIVSFNLHVMTSDYLGLHAVMGHCPPVAVQQRGGSATMLLATKYQIYVIFMYLLRSSAAGPRP